MPLFSRPFRYPSFRARSDAPLLVPVQTSLFSRPLRCPSSRAHSDAPLLAPVQMPLFPRPFVNIRQCCSSQGNEMETGPQTFVFINLKRKISSLGGGRRLFTFKDKNRCKPPSFCFYFRHGRVSQNKSPRVRAADFVIRSALRVMYRTI